MRIKTHLLLLCHLISRRSASSFGTTVRHNNIGSNRSATSSFSSLDMSSSADEKKNDDGGNNMSSSYNDIGRLEELKSRENELSRLLAAIRREKLAVIRSRPLTIGVVGFGRFGQFIAKTFAKYGRVVATSRSDYTSVADAMGVKYVPMDDLEGFVAEELDVIVLAVSILSFEDTLKKLVPIIEKDLGRGDMNENEASSGQRRILPGPLIVDVLSVKDYPRQVMLDLLPPQCDILCTHPMFGPDSGRNGWHNLNFVYERTRIDGLILDPSQDQSFHQLSEADDQQNPNRSQSSSFIDIKGKRHNVHEDSEAHILGMDRMERFLSIWEEEGCRMVALSCKIHDEHAANSQFITHLMGRILGTQGLQPTPIDTRGFESVLKLIDGTTADSFDLFYGLYKYNKNSMETIHKLKGAMDGVVTKLKEMEESDRNTVKWDKAPELIAITPPEEDIPHIIHS